MYCQNCHTEFESDATYCGLCGGPLVNGPVPHGQDNMPVDRFDRGAAGEAIASSNRRFRIKAFVSVAVIALLAGLAVSIYVVFFKPYDIDASNFPDAELRAQLGKRLYDADQDGKLSRAEASAITDLDLSGLEIESLEGLHLLENLTELDLSHSTGLTSAEWDEVPRLESVDLSESDIRSFDGSALPELRALRAKGSALKIIDVSNNTKLEELELDDDVTVEGIESTKLEPRFLLTRYEHAGAAQGFYSGPGQIGYNYDGAMAFAYDENHLLVEKEVSASESGDAWRNHTYRYERDEEGRLLGYRVRDNSASGVYYECVYDEQGNLEWLEQDGGTSEATSVVAMFGYDEKGRIVSTSLVRGGSVYREYTYEYEQGQLTRIHIDFEGGSEDEWVIGRDQSGRITSIVSNFYNLELKYDDRGRCVEKRLASTGANESAIGEWVMTYEFDVDGNVETAHCTFESLGSTYQLDVTCTYDKNGNEIKRYYEERNPLGRASAGYAVFSYQRYFERKDAPELPEVLLAGDCTSVIQSQGALDVDLIRNDSPIVKQFLVQSSALYGEFSL